MLAREEEAERNPMEGLTLAAVEHLPSAVVFVMDLSGTCGKQSAPLLQLQTRELVRERNGPKRLDPRRTDSGWLLLLLLLSLLVSVCLYVCMSIWLLVPAACVHTDPAFERSAERPTSLRRIRWPAVARCALEGRSATRA